MRRREPIRVGDALDDFFANTPNIARKIAEARIPDVWAQVVGNRIASYTTKLEITNGRLFAFIGSSVARNELFMRRTSLPEALNKAVGREVIKTVIIK